MILEIDLSIIEQEKRNLKDLNQEVDNFKNKLEVQGQPHIDYVCRYELLEHDELERIIMNFYKE